MMVHTLGAQKACEVVPFNVVLPLYANFEPHRPAEDLTLKRSATHARQQ